MPVVKPHPSLSQTRLLQIIAGAFVDPATGTIIFPGAASVAWGSITGTLSAQTDLQNALNAKVPYSLFQAKGDIAVGTGAGTAIRFAVSPTNLLGLASDSSQPTGLRWQKFQISAPVNGQPAEATVAAASTLNLVGVAGGAPGALIDVTGTTSIDTINLEVGRTVILRFIASPVGPTLIDSSNLQCLGEDDNPTSLNSYVIVTGTSTGARVEASALANDYSRQTFDNIYINTGGAIRFKPETDGYFDVGIVPGSSQGNFFRFTSEGSVQLISNDLTQAVEFILSGLSTTRAFGFPDHDGTFATLAGTETLTNKTIDVVRTGMITPIGGSGSLWIDLSAGTDKLAWINTDNSGEIVFDMGAVTTLQVWGMPNASGNILLDASLSDDVTLSSDSSTLFPTVHAAKTYADNLKAGLKFKVNCRVASTANVNISSAPASIDAVTLTSGDRVLLKNQTTASQNGSYVFNGAGSAMTRTTDGDTGAELVAATFPISEGTVNQDTWWTVTNDSITIGSTSIVFTQTGGTGTYVAGSGLSLTANSFSIGTGAVTFGMIAAAMIDDTSDGILNGLENVFPTCYAVNAWVAGQIAGFVPTSQLSQSATSASVAQRDVNGVLTATNFNEGYTTTATAAGTTTLSQTDTGLQYFTGSTTQTVKLPVASTMVLGQAYTIVNNSTGAVTVQSSGANTIKILAAGTQCTFTCILTSGTGTASWSAWYQGSSITTAKKLSVSNSLTLAGTDSTTMTFPGSSATIARLDAANASGGLTSSVATGAGIGYATGAGGAVTQATNRTTGVTINKLSGKITTDTTSLAALTTAKFTVTNSTVAVDDTVVVCIRSGATTDSTVARVSAVAAGSFDITVHNLHASTAETGAIIINFAVYKAVSA